jgi:hypothetical protein
MLRLLGWLGVLAGAVSLFRLCYLWIEFDLSIPAALMIDFYTRFFHPLIDLLQPYVPYFARIFFIRIETLPEGWQDIALLYSLIGFSLPRYVAPQLTQFFRLYLEHPIMRVPFIPFLALTFVLIAAFWPAMLVGHLVSLLQKRERDEAESNLRGWAIEIAKSVAVTIAFIALNAAQTSLS